MSNKAMKVDRDMLIFGIRYAIGRQTFAPTIAVENIKHNIENIDNTTIDIILKDIEDHPGSLGMECDKLTWSNLKHFLEKTKKNRTEEQY